MLFSSHDLEQQQICEQWLSFQRHFGDGMHIFGGCSPSIFFTFIARTEKEDKEEQKIIPNSKPECTSVLCPGSSFPATLPGHT